MKPKNSRSILSCWTSSGRLASGGEQFGTTYRQRFRVRPDGVLNKPEYSCFDTSITMENTRSGSEGSIRVKRINKRSSIHRLDSAFFPSLQTRWTRWPHLWYPQLANQSYLPINPTQHHPSLSSLPIVYSVSPFLPSLPLLPCVRHSIQTRRQQIVLWLLQESFEDDLTKPWDRLKYVVQLRELIHTPINNGLHERFFLMNTILASISPSRSLSNWIFRSVSSFSALRSRTWVTWSVALAAISVLASKVYLSIYAPYISSFSDSAYRNFCAYIPARDWRRLGKPQREFRNLPNSNLEVDLSLWMMSSPRFEPTKWV